MSCTDQCQRPTPAQAHCGSCHRTFGGVYGFDMHRSHGTCLDPASLGMANAGGIWRREMRPDVRFPIAGKATEAPNPPDAQDTNQTGVEASYAGRPIPEGW